MGSGQQYYHDKLQDEAYEAEQKKLEEHSVRLGINKTALKQLREFKIAFEKQMNDMPYRMAKNLQYLLDKINTN